MAALAFVMASCSYEFENELSNNAGEQTMNVTIETLDSDGNTIYSKTVENVPFKRNRRTKLTGAKYGASVEAGSFQVNTTWLDEEDPIAV